MLVFSTIDFLFRNVVARHKGILNSFPSFEPHFLPSFLSRTLSWRIKGRVFFSPTTFSSTKHTRCSAFLTLGTISATTPEKFTIPRGFIGKTFHESGSYDRFVPRTSGSSIPIRRFLLEKHLYGCIRETDRTYPNGSNGTIKKKKRRRTRKNKRKKRKKSRGISHLNLSRKKNSLFRYTNKTAWVWTLWRMIERA